MSSIRFYQGSFKSGNWQRDLDLKDENQMLSLQGTVYGDLDQ